VARAVSVDDNINSRSVDNFMTPFNDRIPVFGSLNNATGFHLDTSGNSQGKTAELSGPPVHLRPSGRLARPKHGVSQNLGDEFGTILQVTTMMPAATA
jgi:hypothetical protein